MAVSHTVLSAVFSDESPHYRFPSEPDKGDTVIIRLRVAKDSAERVMLLFESLTVGTMMVKVKSDDFFDYYEAGIICSESEVIYRFLIECPDGTKIAFDKSGAHADDHNIPDLNPAYAFRFIPGFHVPDWAKGAVQYQIFPDRFCNGDPSNDVVDTEYYYIVAIPSMLRTGMRHPQIQISVPSTAVTCRVSWTNWITSRIWALKPCT